MPVFHIPTPLRHLCNQQATVTVDAMHWEDCIAELHITTPELAKALFDDAGKLSSFVQLYHQDTPLKVDTDLTLQTDDEIDILVALSGG